MDDLHTRIILHEGLKLKPYVDTEGKLTIGVGRNLDDVGISQDEALALLEHDLTRCQLCLLQYSWYSALDDVRKGVLIELAFNIGASKVLDFKNMIAALKVKDFKTASSELLNSQWAVEVGKDRSKDMSNRLLTGTYY